MPASRSPVTGTRDGADSASMRQMPEAAELKPDTWRVMQPTLSREPREDQAVPQGAEVADPRSQGRRHSRRPPGVDHRWLAAGVGLRACTPPPRAWWRHGRRPYAAGAGPPSPSYPGRPSARLASTGDVTGGGDDGHAGRDLCRTAPAGPRGAGGCAPVATVHSARAPRPIAAAGPAGGMVPISGPPCTRLHVIPQLVAAAPESRHRT
jgi:hypothetical protein